MLRIGSIAGLLLSWSALSAQEMPPSPTPGPPRGRVVVGFKEEAASTVRHSIRGDFQGDILRRRPGYELWSIPGEYLPSAAAQALREMPHVAWAEPVRRFRSNALPSDPWMRKNPPPGNPCAPDQWGHFRVALPQAWDRVRGNLSTVVAVLDGGIAMAHPQLGGRFWENSRDLPGNSLDDDQNGYIDDTKGFDFCGRNSGDEGEDPLDEDADPDVKCCDPAVGDGKGNGPGPLSRPADAYASHGTLVAGIIAATTDDRFGYSGMDWYCRVMNVRVGNAEGTAFNVDLVDGIHYAVENGARVIYMAYGSMEPDGAVAAAVEWAIEKGALVVVPVGNRGKSGTDHPAALSDLKGLLGVAASDAQDLLARISSFGDGTDLMAPGHHIRGLGIVSAAEATATPSIKPGDPLPDDHCSVLDSGTSLAAAYVAGAAALLLGFDPALSPRDLAFALFKGADKLPEDPKGRPRYRRLNVVGALDVVMRFTPTPAFYSPTPSATFTSTHTITPTATPTWTLSPTPTPTPSKTGSPTPTPTGTMTPPYTETNTRTFTATESPTDTETPVPIVPTPTETFILDLVPVPVSGGPEVWAFPDPARGRLVTFRFKVPSVSNIELQIYDRYGFPATMFQRTAEGWVDIVLLLKELQDGIYTYHARMEDSITGRIEEFRNRKFVVIRENERNRDK